MVEDIEVERYRAVGVLDGLDRDIEVSQDHHGSRKIESKGLGKTKKL